MEVILVLAAWYAVGCAGSLLTFGLWWRDTLDVEGADVLFGLGMALLGPVNLLVGLAFTATWALKRAFPAKTLSTVVWKRK